MLFQVEMTVKLPPDMPAEQAAKIKATEKAYSQDLQNQGKWRHLWRVAGSYSNVSVFDVEDNAELQELVSNLRAVIRSLQNHDKRYKLHNYHLLEIKKLGFVY